jgi:hypothetical protein
MKHISEIDTVLKGLKKTGESITSFVGIINHGQ